MTKNSTAEYQKCPECDSWQRISDCQKRVVVNITMNGDGQWYTIFADVLRSQFRDTVDDSEGMVIALLEARNLELTVDRKKIKKNV